MELMARPKLDNFVLKLDDTTHHINMKYEKRIQKHSILHKKITLIKREFTPILCKTLPKMIK